VSLIAHTELRAESLVFDPDRERLLTFDGPDLLAIDPTTGQPELLCCLYGRGQVPLPGPTTLRSSTEWRA